jgi:hypothetical protein
MECRGVVHWNPWKVNKSKGGRNISTMTSNGSEIDIPYNGLCSTLLASLLERKRIPL